MSPLILPNDKHHVDMRTPLEKDLDVKLPGLYMPDGSFRPTRNAGEEQARLGFLDALKAKGFTVKFENGAYDITPPYPEGANRAERRLIDTHWQKRLQNVLSNVR